jgi:hypothetical protein
LERNVILKSTTEAFRHGENDMAVAGLVHLAHMLPLLGGDGELPDFIQGLAGNLSSVEQKF